MNKTTTPRSQALAVLALLALSTCACASAGAGTGAWQETSAGASRYDSYRPEETEGVTAGEAPSAEPLEVAYDIDRSSDDDAYLEESVQEQFSASGGRRSPPTSENLSDWGGEAERATAPRDQVDRRIAQAAPTPAGGTRSGGAGTAPTSDPSPTANDALAPGRLLLIYTAVLNLAVHQVEDQQNALQAIARAHGGFMARRSGAEMVIRVPAARFEEALAATEALGDVLGRTVDAQDVGEEFRDTNIRLRNLEAMRTRLEELLQHADNVEAALAVEQQLERVTTEIEVLRGRLRSLEDRVTYSTITVHFRARPTAQERVDEFQLPFRWLHRLGLPRLMEVR